MQTYKSGGFIDPLVINFSVKRRSVIIFTREIYCHKNYAVFIKQGPKKVPQTLWQFRRRDKSLAPAGIRKPDRPNSTYHHYIQINQPTRCINLTDLLPVV